MITHAQAISSVALAGRVARYHTWPTLRPQTVGEHSWRVAMIYLRLFGLPRAEVLEYILKHDIGELFAGDTPFYAKQVDEVLKGAVNVAEGRGMTLLNLSLPELTPQEWKNFKLCDLLEMYEFGQIEYRMGNQYGIIVSDNIKSVLFTKMGTADLAAIGMKLWPTEEYLRDSLTRA